MPKVSHLHRHSTKLATLLLGIICICLKYNCTQAYFQVLVNGHDGASDEGPKIFKALNMDLIYPRTFNSSENLIKTPTTTQTTLTNMKQSQPKQQQHPQPSSEQKAHQIAVEQSRIYVTPATDEATPLTTNNYENTKTNISRTAVKLIKTNKMNSMWTVDNEQPGTEHHLNVDETEAYVEEPSRQEEYASTGRAVDYNRPAYNFNQLITPLINNKSPPLVTPSSTQSSSSSSSSTSFVRAHTPKVSSVSQRTPTNIQHIIYPQTNRQRGRPPPPNRAEINKLNGKAQFSDRFTPGEAVASSQFTKHHHHSHTNPSNNKIAAASQIVQQTYNPSPKDLYAFPPNINSQYTSPYQDPKGTLPSSNVNSYAAAPSGPVDANSNYPLSTAASNNDPGYKYPGPTNPNSHDGSMQPVASPIEDQNSEMNAGSDADIDSGTDDTIGVLPASAMSDEGKDMNGKNAGGYNNGVGGGDDGDTGALTDAHDHDHPPPVDDTEYPTPPPGWIEQHPDALHDHPHHTHNHHDFSDHHYSFHDHLPTYPQYIRPYPEIIWNNLNHVSVPPPPPLSSVSTTEMSLPEPPPQEPRVKKYSYFYIGRKLWYIPLYFTVWFSFYVLWLILKSIARHKVNLPNHYVTKRSLSNFDSTETQRNEHINKLTVNVLRKIENFEKEYLT